MHQFQFRLLRSSTPGNLLVIIALSLVSALPASTNPPVSGLLRGSHGLRSLDMNIPALTCALRSNAASTSGLARVLEGFSNDQSYPLTDRRIFRILSTHLGQPDFLFHGPFIAGLSESGLGALEEVLELERDPSCVTYIAIRTNRSSLTRILADRKQDPRRGEEEDSLFFEQIRRLLDILSNSFTVQEMYDRVVTQLSTGMDHESFSRYKSLVELDTPQYDFANLLLRDLPESDSLACRCDGLDPANIDCTLLHILETFQHTNWALQRYVALSGKTWREIVWSGFPKHAKCRISAIERILRSDLMTIDTSLLGVEDHTTADSLAQQIAHVRAIGYESCSLALGQLRDIALFKGCSYGCHAPFRIAN